MTALRRALAPMTIALVLASGAILTRDADHDLRALVLTLLTVGLGLRTRLHPLWLLALGAVLGGTGVV
jgi:chromate transporter